MNGLSEAFSQMMRLFLVCVVVGALLMALAEFLMQPPPSCYLTAMASPEPVPGCEALYQDIADRISGTSHQASRQPSYLERIIEDNAQESSGTVGSTSNASGDTASGGQVGADNHKNSRHGQAGTKSIGQSDTVQSLISAMREDKRGSGIILLDEPEPIWKRLIVPVATGLALFGLILLVSLQFGYTAIGQGLVGLGMILTLTSGGWLIGKLTMQPKPECYLHDKMFKEISPRQYCEMSQSEMTIQIQRLIQNRAVYKLELTRMESQWSQNALVKTKNERVRKEKVVLSEPDDVKQVRAEYNRIEQKIASIRNEELMRSIPDTTLAVLLLIMGLSTTVIGLRLGRMKPQSMLDGLARHEQATEEISRERYESLAELAFATSVEAENHLRHDKLRTCTYCGGDLTVGDLGTIREVTYVKERPDDVVGHDNIVFGKLYFARGPDQRHCSHCNHTNQRLAVHDS